MTLEQRFQSALRAKEPALALRFLISELIQSGRKRDKIYKALEELVLHSRSQPGFRESDEELLLDTMDSLSGWCHPQAQFRRTTNQLRAGSREQPNSGSIGPDALKNRPTH